MDHAQFATLWSGIEHRLRTYLAACVMDPNRCDDLAQQVALECWRKRGEFQPGRDFLAWVLGFARLAMLRGRRDHARDRHLLDEDLVSTLESDLVSMTTQLDERRQALDACRAALDGRARELVELAYGQALPLAVVAKRVKSSHAAIRTALCRIRDRLRECVERRLAGGEP